MAIAVQSSSAATSLTSDIDLAASSTIVSPLPMGFPIAISGKMAGENSA
jgi:hypothetical protein